MALREEKPTLLVAAIEPSGRLYGSEHCLLDIIDGLSNTRFSWRVFLPAGAGFDRLLFARGIACEPLLPGDLGRMPRWRKALAYTQVLRRLREVKPDLLYVNQAGSLRGATLYGRLLGLPIVCQVQTLEDARRLGRKRALHRSVQAFVCNSEFIAAETSCAPQQKCVLYQGLPPGRIENAKRIRLSVRKGAFSCGMRPFMVGILGRIAVSKGHYLLLEAATQIRDLQPACRFVVIGEGLTPKDTRNFEGAVLRNGLGSQFEFRGYRRDLAAELARVDLLAIPSPAEPLGRVLFDAAEHGVPVVVSDGGGLGEITRRFEVGVRFQSGNAAALARALVAAAMSYREVRERFLESSLSMMERLSMRSYLMSVERILSAAAHGKNACEVWLGDE